MEIYEKCILSAIECLVGGMTQQLIVLPALIKDLDSVPSTYIRILTTTCNSSP